MFSGGHKARRLFAVALVAMVYTRHGREPAVPLMVACSICQRATVDHSIPGYPIIPPFSSIPQEYGLHRP